MTLSKHTSRRGLFETFYMFYPPKGEEEPTQQESYCFHLYIILIGKRIWHLQNISLGEDFLKNRIFCDGVGSDDHQKGP